MKRLSALLLTLVLFATSFGTVHAVENSDFSGSISVLNMIDNQVVAETEFRVYRVADVDGSALKWTDRFTSYQLKLDPNDEDSFSTLPMTLSQYIRRDGLEADLALATSAGGRAEFTGLSQGVYLLTGDSCTKGDYRYDVVPALVILPYLNEGSGLWQWNADMEVKHDSVRVSWPSESKPEDTPIHVIVSWNDEGYENRRPDFIHVQLMDGDKVIDTVTLNPRNNWRWTWTDLPPGGQYYVVCENPPEGYYTETGRDGITFLIIHNFVTTIDPEPTPPKDEKPELPSDPENPSSHTDGTSTLPYTGQPWMAVIALSISGIIFALVGAVMMHRTCKNQSVYAGMVGMGLAYVLLAGGLTMYNIKDDHRAGLAAEAARQEVVQVMTDYQKQFEGVKTVPDFEINETMDMPKVLIDENAYIGTVYIPALDIVLPVQTDCTSEGLKTSPGRYTGSIYDDDCIIAGHNYKSHFGRLKNAQEGDSVFFTDIDGNVFEYAVTGIETIGEHDVDEVFADDWDLSLFTCTTGGRSRVVVRCSKLEREAM